MSDNRSIEKIRYEIIEPFLNSEKTLKELSEESEISYSTLKRWVSAYRKKGIDGLKKTQRKDKDTHRSLNDDTYKFLEDIYKNNPNTRIQDLHNLVNKRKKKQGENLISYDTVYRIITNLDPFVKKVAETNYPLARSSNEVFEYTYCELDVKILNEVTDKLEKPILHLIYDSYSKAICSYDLNFSTATVDEILILLRSAIFPDETNSLSVYGKPNKFIINNIRMQGKKRLTEVQRKIDLDIVFSSVQEEKMGVFFKEVNEVYLKDILINENPYPNYKEMFDLVRKYIFEIHNFRKREKWERNLKKIEIITKKEVLDSLLMSIPSTRKIQTTGIRYLNLNFNNRRLNDYIGKKAEIKINYLDVSKMYVYINGFFVCEAICENFLGKETSLYRFQCIKNYMLIKYYKQEFNLNDFGSELEELIENEIY